MTLIGVIELAIHNAKATNTVQYVVKSATSADYHTFMEWKKGWLFRAWPGGRKEFSRAGTVIARELGYIK